MADIPIRDARVSLEDFPVYWAVGNDPMLNGVGVGLIALAAATGAVVGASTRAFADRDLRV